MPKSFCVIPKDLEFKEFKQLAQTDKLHKKVSANIQQCGDII
jgi:hypothetical protein